MLIIYLFIYNVLISLHRSTLKSYSHEKKLHFLLIGFCVFLVFSCNEESSYSAKQKSECQLYYNTFLNEFMSLDKNIDIQLTADSIRLKYGALYPELFETVVASPNFRYSLDVDGYNTQSIVEIVSELYDSDISKTIAKKIVVSTLEGYLDIDNLLATLSTNELTTRENLRLSWLLAYCGTLLNIENTEGIIETKGKFDDCYSRYLRDVSRARERVMLTAAGGLFSPVAAVIAIVGYQTDLETADDDFYECAK